MAQLSLGRLLAGLALVAALCFQLALAKPKGASLTVKARFNATSYLLEAVEFLAEEDASLVWKYLDVMAEAAPGGGGEAGDEGCWQDVTHKAAQLVSPSVGKLIPLVLGSRQYAAKLQMVAQVAAQFHPQQTACCFVSLGGREATTPEQLAELLEAGEALAAVPDPGSESGSSTEQLFSFDHVYPAPSARDRTRAAVLYGAPGLPCFAPLHAALKAAAEEEGGPAYAFRPLLQPQCESASGCARPGAGGPLLLPGWGVEAALKNMEYSALDDKARKEAAEKGDEGEAGGEGGDDSFGSGEAAVVKGFRMDVLASRKPELRQELLTLKDQLLTADDDEATLKVWDLRDVGLQATQRILSSADPLGMLAEVSQNFPGIVSSLSRQSVNQSLRTAVDANQQYLSAGSNLMLLNGLAVDINSLDYYAFLSRLRGEMRLRDSLVAAAPLGLGLPAGLAQGVMALRAEEGAGGAGGGAGGPGPSGGSDEPRLSLGTASTMAKHVAWLNNLEKDSRYQRFGRSVTELLNVYPGRFKPLGRNILNAVIVAEPLCASSLELAGAVDQMWQGGYPIRFGVVFHLPSVVSRLVTARRYPFLASQRGAPSWDEMDASERFGRAFATLREAFGAPAAWKMWSNVAEAVGAGTVSDPAEAVDGAFTAAWAATARNPPPGARAKAAARKTPAAALMMLKEGSGYAAEVGMALSDTASWLLARGLVQPPPVKAEAEEEEAAAGAVATGPPEDSETCELPPLVWVNGLPNRATGQASVAEELMYKVMGEMQQMQQWVYFGKVSDESAGGDVLQAVLEVTGAVERVNPRIVGAAAAKNTKMVALAPLLRHPAHATLQSLWRDAAAASSKNDAKAAPRRVASMTHLVAADLGTSEGRGLVAESLRFLAEGASSAVRDARLVLLANPAAGPVSAPSLLELVVQGALRQLGGDGSAAMPAVLTFLSRLLGDSALVARLGGELASGSAEEAAVAVKFAEEAGLNSKALLSWLMAVVDEVLLPAGGVRGGTRSLVYRISQAELCGSVLGLAPGAAAVVSNGRVTEVFTPGGEYHELVAEDFPLLQLAAAGVAGAVAKVLRKAHEVEPLQGVPAGLIDPASLDALSDLTAATCSVLAASAAANSAPEVGAGGGSRMAAGSSKQLQQMMARIKGRTLQVTGTADGPPPFHVEAILNPLSRPAQRLSALLLLLREALGPSMSLALNPQRDVTEMPLKSYYRYAVPQGLAASASSAPSAPSAYFSRLPARRVLTLNMDVPEAWLVEPATALHDLDNLKLEDVPGEDAFFEFELDALMLTGSCVDVTASGRMTPPRGLQLHLGTPSRPHTVDTLVMANLAYFQLKAAPGRWLLSLAPGRSRELYSLVSGGGNSAEAWSADDGEVLGGEDDPRVSGGGDVSTQVLISSFMGKHAIVRVRKRPGMEGEDVLKAAGAEQEEPEPEPHNPDLEDDEYVDEDDEKPHAPAPSLLGRVSDMIMGKGGKDSGAVAVKKPLPGGDTINVFTVASGHMYERLQKIMMMSVLRHTKSKVKFWIIKNYMSPQHKQVIPALAAKFGFEYEFVTYKWPHWLHKQTDKQRLIWAYKILFLDVLFPLGVERIIFVDSDQIIRTDLAELYHMDIKGAPYAYTPFCDNNRETDEYRFWKGGFWRDHLQGKPYHISALYLVDLKRFRQIAAGDQLRVVYDQLSKDPNSLANLDQDLPNYAQHSIRIHSLPQEWLWCESWCGNSTKAKAKTIDLCNNPKTKEPKLVAARRIIGPLWEELDAAAEGVTRDVQRLLEAAETGLPLPAGETADSAAATEAGGGVGSEATAAEAGAAEVEDGGWAAESPEAEAPGRGDRSEL